MSEDLSQDTESSQNLSNETEDETVFEAIDLVYDFLDDFFNDAYEVLRFNMNFLESNGFEYQTKIDYMKLNRFISAAYNAILANDFQVVDVLISKFYKDIIFLNSFYKDFLIRCKDPSIIYKNHFIKYYGGMPELVKLLLPKDKKDVEITEEDIEEANSFFKEQFESNFEKEFSTFKEKLKLVINTKTYYFDSLLWQEARKSQSIHEFFKKAKRQETNLDEPLSTKIFIKQYMRTIDKSHTKNQHWHEYLEKVLKIMD